MAEDDYTDYGRRKPPYQGSYFPAAGQYIGGIHQPAVNALNRPLSQYGTPAAGKRLGREDLVTYQTPSGGFATVKRGSTAPQGSTLYSVGNQAPVDLNAAYARGYGAPNPQPLSGGFLSQGGVAFPAEQLTPQQRGLYGFSGDFGQSFGEKFAANNPNISGGLSLLGRAGTLGYNALASLLGGGQNQRSQQSQNFYAYNPSPVPRQPTRYFDF